jgi:hypothetical protein
LRDSEQLRANLQLDCFAFPRSIRRQFVLPTKREIIVDFPVDNADDSSLENFAKEYLRRTFGYKGVLTVEQKQNKYCIRIPARDNITSADAHSLHFVTPTGRQVDWRWPVGTETPIAIQDIAGLFGISLKRLIYLCPIRGRPFQLELLPQQVRYIQELAGQRIELARH